ncbi:uncharacterized protein L3040_008111 [Drepanopeziza brunnea f. sp. 'multigermtubi']|uniref:uncharacterized protein n=1 Tax=Drepanopeziza brunnea f. sp. 'multigermtubi' TaxID=698441 RepID=UPI002385F5DF|nr:hypothetical protein L3040_008111 [Drepanopeziza brunnea f. sp. 'multigermtubi']
MGQQPSIPTDLSRELQVIGAGFSRTGTVSFAMALERLLSGPVCHSGTAILLREEAYVQKWIAIQQKGAAEEVVERNLRDLTAGYVGTTDTPAIQFTEELTRLYPDAVVICSTRDQDSWWRSAQALMQNTGLWWLDLVFWPVPTLRYFGRWRDSIGDRLEKVYQTSRDNMNGPQLLELHEAYIRRVVPPERLFFFNVKDGWEPLCKILNCPVPDEPFPRANDAKAMQEFFEKMLKAALVKWMQISVISGACIAMVFWAWM